MNKLLSLTLAGLLALSLTACAGAGQNPPESSAAPSVRGAETSAADSAADSAAAVPAVALEDQKKEYREDTGETVVMRDEWQVPTVTIPGNEAAQKAVQEDLDQIVDSFRTLSGEGLKAGKEAFRTSEEPEDFFPFFHSLTFETARCDGAVLSLIVTEAGYEGGAHGLTYRYGRSYDAATGARLTLNDAGEGIAETAIPILEKFVRAVHDRDGIFFEETDDEALRGNLKSVVTDELFYFSDDGLVFISGQYQLQPYAAGIIPFTISYDDLSGRLNEAYNPGGGVTKCETMDTVYTFDADGTLQAAPVPDDDAA